jgi:hypothetical protein
LVREMGEVLTFDVLDPEVFVSAVLALPGVRRFAGIGDSPPRRWPRALRAASERHAVERDEAVDPWGRTRGFRVHAGSRAAIAALFTHRRKHPGWYMYHWWAYSNDAILVSCYDWIEGPNFMHPSLEDWARELETHGVIRLNSPQVFTAEWYEGRG